jgi:hypothetical protein
VVLITSARKLLLTSAAWTLKCAAWRHRALRREGLVGWRRRSGRSTSRRRRRDSADAAIISTAVLFVIAHPGSSVAAAVQPASLTRIFCTTIKRRLRKSYTPLNAMFKLNHHHLEI